VADAPDAAEPEHSVEALRLRVAALEAGNSALRQELAALTQARQP
jgi:hypothetical protein